MDYQKKLHRQLHLSLWLGALLCAGAGVGLWELMNSVLASDTTLAILSFGLLIVVVTALGARVATILALQPLSTLVSVIVYTGHSARSGVAPQPENLKIGRELIVNLAAQVYDLASMSGESAHLSLAATPTTPSPTNATLSPLDHLGIPVIGIDNEQKVTMLNRAALNYFGLTASVLGVPLYDSFKFAFRSEETLDSWLADRSANSVLAEKTWERVRILDGEGKVQKQFDLVAQYAKGSADGTETLLALFDRTDQYSRDDQETSFVAMAVHELRTPLTIMKGYIEVFEDEVGPNLSPELTDFMKKMQASAQQLTAFVGNILNVARVEENQLTLKLQPYNWSEVLQSAVNDLSLRASVYGILLEVKIDPSLPQVAIDRISTHEVINNLVDNAIKYSGESKKITITSVLSHEGLVETTVQDYGIGIPASVVPELFQKYYRSHKSRVQISGTGLGLYLCKAIVSAQGGNIWVRSKEGEGSAFTFTLQPYDAVKHEQTSGEDGIMRGAHGWIKNHSMNRQ